MIHLPIERIKQPPNECEPTCLKQILDYFGIDSNLDDLIKRISGDKFKWHNWDYNTGRVAIEHGLNVIIYTRSAGIFDPTWFDLPTEDLLTKLKEERAYLRTEDYVGLPSFREDAEAAVSFLENGGKIVFTPISEKLIKSQLDQHNPLIAGVCYTLL
ncbi:C39 family peptidase, partial [Candidatus Woesearchaeota archaeon]|nr:C39 family peptidase [Candidatus Woesearchaeota archaeon]